MIQKSDQVIDEGRRPPSVIAREAKPSVIKGDDLEVFRPHRHLLPPVQVIAAYAVRQHNAGACTMNFVVEIDTVDQRCRQ
jgi:hypothetical protein